MVAEEECVPRPTSNGMKGPSIFQTVLLASFGACAIAGILIFAFVVGGGGGGGIGEVSVWGTFDETAVNTVMRQLSDGDARFKSIRYTQKNADTYQEELTEALAAGTGPDLFVITAEYAQKNAAKITPIPYAGISRDQFESTFVEAAEPFLSAQGVLAIPLGVDPIILYWNRDLFSSAGLAQPPRFWADLYDIATNITKRSQSNVIETSAAAFGEYQNITHAKDILAALILQAGGEIIGVDSAGKFVPALVPRGSTAQQATESAVRFYTEFANPSKAYYSWNRALPESRQAFTSGDLALYLGRASENALLRRMNPNLNFGATSTPQVRGGSRLLTTGETYGLAIARTGKNQQGALTAAFLLGAPEASSALSVALGVPSARRDVLAQTIASGQNALPAREALLVRSWADPDPQKTDAIFRDMIQDVTSGALRITEAVQRADQALGLLLQ